MPSVHLTDEQWAFIQPFVPPPARTGRPRDYNDRLLLGLRGMLSEAELHLLKLRLKEGRLRRVERGEYRHHVLTGLTRLPDGRIVKDPNQAVQHSPCTYKRPSTCWHTCVKGACSDATGGAPAPAKLHEM